MPDEKKADPFKPTQPSIPGVPLNSAAGARGGSANYVGARGAEVASQKIILLAVTGAVVLVVILAFMMLHRGSSSRASALPGTATATPANSPSAQPAKPAESWPIAPGPVATVQELEKPWAAKKFLFRDPITSEPVPAMVVALPGGSYWAFSLREPFGNCDLAYVTNLAQLHTDYNYHAEHPMVVDSCNNTIYDLLRYGGASDGGGLVRGEIVQGNGIRPPMAIEVRVEGKNVMAVRME